jgi:hypothetical protein
MRISTPNTGRPCLRWIAICWSLGQVFIAGVSPQKVPSGLVSVMPQAWRTSTP